jgi:hypothetical protein
MVALLIMLGNTIPLPLLIFLAFITIAAPLIREFRRHTDLDERQLQIGHYSSHIAYFVFLILLCMVLIKEWIMKGQRPDIILFVLLLLPIVIKTVICIFQNYGLAAGIHGFIALFFRGVVPQKLLDERQHIIGNFSSHIAFYLYVATVVFYVIFKYIAVHKHPGNMWYMLLIVPILIKFYVSLLKNFGAGTGARMICFTITGIFLIFTLLSHGISLEMIIEAAPFLFFFAAALLSFRFPKMGGFIFLALGVGSLLFFNWQNFEICLRILMYSIIPLPLVLSGIALMTVKKIET